MVHTTFDYPLPRGDEPFEIFCLALLRWHLSAPMLQRHGRKGQRQDGVDLSGVTKEGVHVGVQCKARALGRMVTLDELDHEVEKARGFQPSLDQFILATTAQRDSVLQSRAAQLTQDHKKLGCFSVNVIAFEDLQDILRSNHELAVELCDLHAGRTTVSISELHLHSTPIYSDWRPGADIQLDQRSASDWIRSGQAEAAVDLLSRRKSEQWNQLRDPERLALLVALGNALLAARRNAEASQHYFQASQLASDADGSQSLAALSYFLVGDKKRTRKHALQALKINAAEPRAHMLRLRTEPPRRPFATLLRQTPGPVRSHPEVALALYERAAAEGKAEKSEAIVRAGLSRENPWPPLSLALASILVEEQIAHLRDTGGAYLASPSHRLDEAIAILSSIIDESRLRDPDGVYLEALLKRAVSYRLLRRDDASTADIEAAFAHSPKSARVAILYAEVLAVERGQEDRAILVLESARAADSNEAADLFLAELLRRRGSRSDLERALSLLQKALPFPSLEPEEARVEAALLLTDVLFALERPESAADFSQRTDDLRLTTASRALVETDRLRRLGDDEGVRVLASAAITAGRNPGPRSSRIRLARNLLEAGYPREAFLILRDLVGPASAAREKNELLHCARSCGEDEFALAFCANQRATGVAQIECLGHEVELLLKYDEYRGAKRALQEYLAIRPDDRIALVHLRWLALRYRWKDELPHGDDVLLPVNDVPEPSTGAEIVDVLRHSGRPEEALAYAYELWRKFPQESLAHRALVTAVLLPGPQRLTIPEAVAVAPGMAVSFKEVDTAEIKWIVIETSSNPRLEVAEVPPDHELSKRMMGLAVGDEFELPGTGLRTRSAVVLSIRDRRIYRAQEAMLNWQSRFPTEGFLEPIPVGGGARDTKGQPDFSEIENTARRIAEHQAELESAYASGRLPIGTLALFQKKTVVETVEYLALNSETKVFAAPGRLDDLTRAIGSLNDERPIVLDSSAVATLALLDSLEILTSLSRQVLVLESTLAEIEELQNDPFVGQEQRSFLGYRGGRVVFTQVEARDLEERREHFYNIGLSLERHCQVIGGRDLAALRTDLRSRLSEVLPPSSLQSIAAAAAREIPLWSDDLRAIQLARESGIGVTHVWTHAVLGWAAQTGALRTDTHALLATRLLEHGYTFTSINAHVILTSITALQWDLSSEGAQALFRQFSDVSWNPATAQGLLAETLEGLWRGAATVELAREATRSILSNFAQRAGHKAILRRIAHQAGNSLGLWPARAQEYREYLRHYLEFGAFLV